MPQSDGPPSLLPFPPQRCLFFLIRDQVYSLLASPWRVFPFPTGDAEPGSLAIFLLFLSKGWPDFPSAMIPSLPPADHEKHFLFSSARYRPLFVEEIIRFPPQLRKLFLSLPDSAPFLFSLLDWTCTSSLPSAMGFGLEGKRAPFPPMTLNTDVSLSLRAGPLFARHKSPFRDAPFSKGASPPLSPLVDSSQVWAFSLRRQRRSLPPPFPGRSSLSFGQRDVPDRTLLPFLQRFRPFFFSK